MLFNLCLAFSFILVWGCFFFFFFHMRPTLPVNVGYVFTDRYSSHLKYTLNRHWTTVVFEVVRLVHQIYHILLYLKAASVYKQRWVMFRRKLPSKCNCPLMSAISATTNSQKGMHLSRWRQTMKEQRREVIMELLHSQLDFPHKNLLCFCSQAAFVYL